MTTQSIGRRDALALMIQALLLALFPWLRTERGQQATLVFARQLAPYWLDGNPYMSWADMYAAVTRKSGSSTIVIDDSFPSAVVAPGVYDLTGVTLTAGPDDV